MGNSDSQEDGLSSGMLCRSATTKNTLDKKKVKSKSRRCLINVQKTENRFRNSMMS